MRGTNMKNTLYITALSILLTLFSLKPLQAKSYYYYQDFSGTQASLEANGWDFTFPMNRFFLVDNTTNAGTPYFWVSNQPANNRAYLYGDPNADPVYDQWYTGKGILFRLLNNSQFGSVTATPENPFGFEVIRYNAYVHRDPGPTFTPNNTGNNDDDYGKGLMEVWLLEDNGANIEGDSFNNYVFWYDKAYNHNNVNNRTNNVWGYFDQSERDVFGNSTWSNLVDIDGNSMNPNTYHRKQYSYANYQATNELGIRMIHDGEKVTIYLNLDPLGDSSPLQNSWVKFAEVDVAWSQNLGVYFSAESPTPEGNGVGPVWTYTMAQFGDFSIRSIASNLSASITPKKVRVNSSVTFTATLNVENVTVDDSGVGEIYIKAPNGYGAFNVNSVAVNHPDHGSLNRQTGAVYGYGSLGSSDFYAGTRDGMLYIRLNMGGTDAANHILTNGTITISFDMTTGSSPNSSGDDFKIYGDAVKHAGTGQDILLGGTMKYATTGRKKAYPVNTGELTVQVYDQPQSIADVQYSPKPLIQGNEQADFTVRLSTEGLVNTPDISKIRIQIPSGFVVSNNTVNNPIVSSVLGPYKSTNNIFVASNFIYVFYTNINGFPGSDGFDKVQFSVWGTPVGFVGSYTNYRWKVGVNSEELIAGTSWQDALTNSVYKSQNVRVAMSNAMALGYIVTKTAPNINAKTGIFTNTAWNTNNYTYVVYNNGVVGNNVKQLRITIPAVFDQITGVVSSNGGTNYVSGGYIYVDYTNDLVPGEKDMISFKGRHTITDINSSPSNVAFTLYADNWNSAGLTPQAQDAPRTWTVTISPPLPSAENKFSPTTVYTTAVTNNLSMSLYNTSPNGVGINLARIDIPSSYFTYLSASSTHLASQSHITLSNLAAGTNSVLIRYYADGNGALPSYYDNSLGDTISLNLLDSISYNTFTEMPTNLHFPVFVYKTSYITNDTNFYAVSTIGERFPGTNELTIEYPLVDAAYYITNKDANQLSSTSITNSLTYFITNRGAIGNRITNVYINIPTDVSVNFSVNSISKGNAVVQMGGAPYNRIWINFPSPLDGGEQTVVRFTMIDNVDAEDKANVYLYPDVENNRGLTTGLTNIVSGKSGKIDFSLPKPNGGGTVSPTVFFVTKNEAVSSVITQDFRLVFTNTGIGTDLFKAVQVNVPLPLRGKVYNVASQKLGTDLLGTPGYFNNNYSNIQVIYSNAGAPVLAGQGDVLTVTVRISNVNSLPTNGTWDFLANNGFVDNGFAPPRKYFDLTNVNMGSRQAYGVERLSANLVSHTLTTEITNTFSYTIKNGSAGNLVVNKVRIKIPQPPYVSVNPATIFVSGVSADASVSGGYIWLTNFSGGGLTGGGQSTLTITALKSILLDSTNVKWVAEAYYTNDSSYQPLPTKGTNSEEIQLPPPSYYAYVDQTQIGKDNTSTDIKLYVTNVGANGNRITLLKIIPPTTNEGLPKLIVTNISSLTHSLGGNIWYSNNGILYVDYSTANTNIASKKKDVINMKVWDNQANIGFSGDWKVYAASKSTDPVTNVSKDPVDIGQSLKYTLVVPAYGSSYYVTPNSVNTVSSSNPIAVYLNNTGGGNNNIITSRIVFGYPFVTNGLVVTTTMGTNYHIGSNYVEVYYRDGRFAPASNDVVTLTMQDGFVYGETNTVLSVSAQYNTSGTTYVGSGIVVGENNSVDFVMPYPDVVSEIQYNDVYTSQDKARLTVRFINKGTGSNALQRLKIYVPTEFAGGLNSSKVTDSLATNKSVVSNQITLWYAGFSAGVTNTLVLDLTNTRKTKGNLYMESYAFNGLKETNTSGVVDSKTNHIVSPPSAELVNLTLNSPDVTNDVTLKLYNDSDGTSSIYYVRVDVPGIFTNLYSVTSASGTVISNSVNNIVVQYPSGLATGSQDTINLKLNDSQDMFETTGLNWTVAVNNQTGWGNALPYISGALSQSMIIPMPEITNKIKTKWFVIKTGTEVPTNTFAVVISNKSVGHNLISSNVIVLPTELNTIVSGSLICSYPGAVITNSGNKVIITYTNAGKFTGGETNRVSFKFRNLVSLQTTVNLDFYAYNGTSLGSYNGALKKSQTVNFNAPQNPTEAYVENKQVLYSIDHSAEILYHVNNGLYDLDIEQLRIGFTNILKITNIYSELYGQNLSFTTNSNTIQINYVPLGNIPNKLDASGGRETLHIYVVYTNNSSYTNKMAGYVLFEDSIEYSATKKPTGENNFVPVLVANFGRITGYVLPGNANPTVRLYYQGTTTEVTNQFTNLIITGAAADGKFTLDFIPGLNGKIYDVAFNGDNYKSSILTNVLVSNNVITGIGTMKMVRDLFSLSATTAQTSMSLDDLATEVIVPAGTLKDRFSLNIWITNMNTEQQAKVNGGSIDIPNDVSSLGMFWFDMKDYNGNILEEVELDGDVYIKLHYDDTNITAQGWSENSLAVYYWNESQQSWKRIGGTVDSASNYVMIRSSYLRKNYAILGEGTLSTVKPGFVEVNVYPKVFTPTAGDNNYANVKISASFENTVDSYEVRIYNLSGTLVKQYTREEGGYSQGEVFWDGYDQEGFAVRSGVYVYRIMAGGNSYTGTIVIAK